jgi:hypothetical protein
MIVIFTITVLRKVTPCYFLDDLLGAELLRIIFHKTAVLTSLFTHFTACNLLAQVDILSSALLSSKILSACAFDVDINM